MEEKHKKEVVALRMQLEEQLSTKVKESNQLLNLRKMEEQAAKQKKYSSINLVMFRLIESNKKLMKFMVTSSGIGWMQDKTKFKLPLKI